MLHFEQFLIDNELTVNDEIRQMLSTILIEKVSSATFENEGISNFFSKYSAYKHDTLNGKHGKTEKFYMILIEFIQNYFIFSRSIRTGDFDTYKFIIPKLINTFFSLNQPNYSR